MRSYLFSLVLILGVMVPMGEYNLAASLRDQLEVY